MARPSIPRAQVLAFVMDQIALELERLEQLKRVARLLETTGRVPEVPYADER